MYSKLQKTERLRSERQVSISGRGIHLLMVILLLAGGLASPRLLAGSVAGVTLFSPAAVVSRFEAGARKDGTVVVQWRTTLELGVDAFRVKREQAGGTSGWVGAGYVNSRGEESGSEYELADNLVHAGDVVRYDLLIVSHHGPDRQVATWSGVVGPAPEQPPIAVATAAVVAQASGTRTSGSPMSLTQLPWIGTGDRVRLWPANTPPADRVRCSVREEGLFGVNAQELANAGGWDLESVEQAMAGTNFSVSCQGAPVAWMADGTNLLFYGLPADSPFAPENVYWVARGAGTNMPCPARKAETPATTNQWFIDRIVRQGTTYLSRVSYGSLADAPPSYVAFSMLNAGGSQVNVETLTDCSTNAWTGSATVDLLSLYYDETSPDVHNASVSIGGTLVGQPSWSNEQYLSFTYPFDSGSVSGGTASLKLQNAGTLPFGVTDYTRFLYMSYTLAYARCYRARNGFLRCTGGDANTVAISGFASNDVMVLDVTATNQPSVVAPVALACDPVAGTWTAAFPCGGTDRVYLAWSKSAGTKLPAVRGAWDVDWSTSSNAVDYAILIPPEAWRGDFRAALQPLADFRNAQGLRTTIVDVESLYNRYSFGLADPQAIRAFCCAGRSNWTARPLQYVLLAGAGSLDFKFQRFSVNDYTACLIPSILAGERFSNGDGMIAVLDSAMGDVDGDGLPEVAIGRLPTTATQDLVVAVQKTLAYEGALLRDDGSLAKQYVSVTPDWDNTGTQAYPFSAGTDRLIAPLQAAGRTFVSNYPVASEPNDMNAVQATLFPTLNAGTGLFHFFGHSNKSSLSDGKDASGNALRLLWYYDIVPGNWQRPTVAVILGCQVNVWQYLTSSANIVPYGLFAPDTGFVAAIGATGYLLADESENLGVWLYTDAEEQGTLRLGDVFLRGLRREAANALNPGRLNAPECYEATTRRLSLSLVGDPALVFRHDRTAMGTDVPWLVQMGQTAPNADLNDPDGDGWPTWMEYLAGTSPTNFSLRITALDPRQPAPRLSIGFETDSHHAYQIDYRGSLLDTNGWQVVNWSWTNAVEWSSAGQPITPQGPITWVDVSTSTAPTQGFFRVRRIE